MKMFVIAAIAISLSSQAARAGQPAEGALAGLQNAAAGLTAVTAADIPAARPAAVLPEGLNRALASDVLDLSASNASFLASYARTSGYAVFELDGTKMKTKPELLAYTARTLGLPADMGNWDAMIDYLGDMPTFHHNNKILILIRNSSAIFNSDQKLYDELRNVTQLACQNAHEWSRFAVTLKFAFIP